MTPCILQETSRGTQALCIDDAMLMKREIFLTGDVTAATSASLIKQLMYLEQADPNSPVTLYISSPGGSVSDGMAVYDYIRLMQAPVNTVCIGIAASMASILFMAGKERSMLPHARVMIHDPSYGGGSMAGQKPLELQDRVNELMSLRKMLADVIVERTGMPRKRVLALTKKDTYFSADRAVKEGIATKILRKPRTAEFIIDDDDIILNE